MDLQQIKKEILEHLFNVYQNDSDTAIFDVSEITKKYNVAGHEIGSYLVRNGWVKNQRYNMGLACTITLSGINEVNSEYVFGNCNKVISTLGLLGGTGMLMEVLDLPRDKYQSARDIADYLKNSRYITVLYSQGDGQITLTPEGWEFYNTNFNNE